MHHTVAVYTNTGGSTQTVKEVDNDAGQTLDLYVK